jgi:uncharacterized membrane protein
LFQTWAFRLISREQHIISNLQQIKELLLPFNGGAQQVKHAADLCFIVRQVSPFCLQNRTGLLIVLKEGAHYLKRTPDQGLHDAVFSMAFVSLSI